MRKRSSVFSSFGLALSAVMAMASSALAQQAGPPPVTQSAARGSITGIITTAQGVPVPDMIVRVPRTNYAANTNAAGRYTIMNVPPNIYVVEAARIGFALSVKTDIKVVAGSATTVDFTVSETVQRLMAVVSTGLSDPTSSGKTPFVVTRVTSADLPVQSTGDPIAALAGKVAGLTIRTGGGPGADVSIQLRNPASFRANTQPMIIIDGVIQMQDDPTVGANTFRGSPLDFDPADIESMEIVKGAAASALYGQKAANGVISIRTNRGNNMALGTSRMTVATEDGATRLGHVPKMNTHHRYLQDANKQLIDPFGQPATYSTGRTNDPNGFIDNEYGGKTYDHIKQVMGTGLTSINTVTLATSGLATNMNIAISSNIETGILKAPVGGTERQSIRLNVDHRFGDKFQVSLGSFFNNQDLTLQDLGVDAFRAIQVISPTIDLFAKDANGNYIPHPDTDLKDNESFNPIYGASVRESYEKRIGFQANLDGTFKPTSFLTLGFLGGYQRSDRSGIDTYIPPGTYSAQGTFPYPGRLITSRNFSEAFNTQLRMSLLRAFGPITARSTVSALSTFRDDNGVTLQGDTLSSGLTKDLDNARFLESNGHVLRTTKSLSYSGNAALDYDGKYIVEALYRRDGSSLLPPATRWQGNFRGSLAWQVANESWWPLMDIPVFKMRYSIGTAGNNPNFDDRYETYNVSSGSGRITKANSGNDQIKPEHVTEQEMGVDWSFRNKLNFELTYARQYTKDAIRADSILNYVGVNTQVRNMGDLRGDTYEATVQAELFRRRNFTWSSTWTMDRSREKIVKYPRNCIGDVNAQFQKECEGFVFGQLSINRNIISDKEKLSFIHAKNGHLDQFDINDDGIVVAVGPNGSWKDGRWGSTVVIDNISYQWGMPIQWSDVDTLGRRTGYHQAMIAQSLPDFQFGFGNDVTVGKLWAFHMQLVGAKGGYNYNFGRQARYYDETDGDLDQFGKPEYAKKPVQYYNGARSNMNAGLNENSCALDDQCRSSSWFIEPAGFVKISAAQARYRLDNPGVLKRLGVKQGTFSLTARNLYSFTKYKGYDPEVGTASGIRQDGTATRPVTYPTYRTYTAKVSLAF